MWEWLRVIDTEGDNFILHLIYKRYNEICAAVAASEHEHLAKRAAWGTATNGEY